MQQRARDEMGKMNLSGREIECEQISTKVKGPRSAQPGVRNSYKETSKVRLCFRVRGAVAVGLSVRFSNALIARRHLLPTRSESDKRDSERFRSNG